MSPGAATLVALLASTLLVMLVIGAHYEVLSLLSRLLPRLAGAARRKVALGIFVAILAHVVEAMVFAVGYALLIALGAGEISGAEGSELDLVYFSMSTYTTLGFGDIVTHGALRVLAGVEAITGLVLIGWTASFTYVQMQLYWNRAREEGL